MTNPTSGAVPRISATIKWYDRAKGLGFLVRDNGSFDICFREPVLTALGLVTLPRGVAGGLRDGAGRARTGGPRQCPAMPATYGRDSSRRAARPPASATAHDRRARIMTTKGWEDDA